MTIFLTFYLYAKLLKFGTKKSGTCFTNSYNDSQSDSLHNSFFFFCYLIRHIVLLIYRACSIISLLNIFFCLLYFVFTTINNLDPSTLVLSVPEGRYLVTVFFFLFHHLRNLFVYKKMSEIPFFMTITHNKRFVSLG